MRSEQLRSYKLISRNEDTPVDVYKRQPQSHTEIELVTDSIPQILCVWTLAGENQEEASLPPKHNDLDVYKRQA